MILKHYLESISRSVKKFNNFLKRHPNFLRPTANISAARAAISDTVINSYLHIFKVTPEGIPANQIYNYDETNLTDNPGNWNYIRKRGCKYPELILNTSKSSTSLMACGNAVGEILAPYVVYECTKLWSIWCEKGSKNTKYNYTSSGWFDTQILVDMFERVLIPAVHHKHNCKVLIDDNLPSHYSAEVVKLFQDHDIKLVFLLPNSTHLTQPLDVD